MTHRCFAACFLTTLCAVVPPTTAQEQLWIRQFGTALEDQLYALCPDGVGGAFVAGETRGSLGAPGVGDTDAWLARYDHDGSRAWLSQFGSAGADRIRALCPDGVGGVFAAGTTRGSLGGTTAGDDDAWLARYDGDGSRMWIRQFGTPAADRATAISSDGAGGVFVAGETGGNLGGSGAGYDAWLARYDQEGGRTWIRQFGSSDFDSAESLCLDGAGGAFVAGWTDGSLAGTTAGREDVWLARYNSAGHQVWLIQLGSTGTDYLWALCPDAVGGAVIAGETSGSLGGPSAGVYDVWLARYDDAGNQAWIRQFGTSLSDGALALCPDGAGGAFVAGGTALSLAGSSAGMRDAWLARYDSAGNRAWIWQFGSSAVDSAESLCSDEAGGAFVAGYSFGRLGGPPAGESDVWLARYDDTACPADCDRDGDLTFFDFLCFQNLFAAGDPGADCDEDGTLTFFDFLCFQNAFAAGCP